MKLFERENLFDRMFRKKLSDYEFDRPDHLWKGIEDQLEKSASRKLLYGPFLNNVLLIVSLLATTSVGAYYLYNSKFNTPAPPVENIIDNQKEQKEATALLNYSKSDTYDEVAVNSTENKVENIQSSSFQNSQLVNNSHKVDNRPKGSVSAYSSNLNKNAEGGNSTANANDLMTQIQRENISVNEEMIAQEGLSLVSEGVTARQFSMLSPLETRISRLRYSEHKKPKKLSRKDAADGCALKRPEKTKFFIDAYYQPEVLSNSIKASDKTYANYASERANSESFVMSNSFGFRASVTLPSGLSFRSGLNISKAEERFDYVKERQEIMIIIKDKNNVPIDTITEFKIITDKRYNNYEFYDIPLVVGYELNLKDFILTVNGGLGLNVAFNQEGEVYSPDLTGKYYLSGGSNIDGVYKVFKSKAGISVLGSFGLNYKITPRWSLIAEPSFRYYIKSLSDPTYPLSQNFGSFGLMAGLRYRIK